MNKINITSEQLVEIEKLLAPYKQMYEYDYSKDEFNKSNKQGYLLYDFYKKLYSYKKKLEMPQNQLKGQER